MKTLHLVTSVVHGGGRLWSRAWLAYTFIFGVALVLLGGCDTEPESHVVSAPPPPAPGTVPATTVVTTTPAPAQVSPSPSTNTVVVTQAPPALQAEVVQAQPSPEYKWVPGYWTWRDGRYEWMAGHWEIPPRSDAVWVAPHWNAEAGGYRFYEGYWN
jgi:hypothetical protein